LQAKKQGKADIETIIQRAVKAGIEAGRTQAGQAPVDAYRATERRLYALPVLVKKVEEARRRLDDLVNHGPQERSKDIVRFARSGMRLSADDMYEALITDEKASIAADENEIATVKKALENIQDDQYYLVVKGRYFEGLTDEEIAKVIPCDTRTVRRQRGRLVRVVAVWLYGAEAV